MLTSEDFPTFSLSHHISIIDPWNKLLKAIYCHVLGHYTNTLSLMNYYLSPFINIYQPAKTNASGKEGEVPKALSALPVAGIFGVYNNLQQKKNKS